MPHTTQDVTAASNEKTNGGLDDGVSVGSLHAARIAMQVGKGDRQLRRAATGVVGVDLTLLAQSMAVSSRIDGQD